MGALHEGQVDLGAQAKVVKCKEELNVFCEGEK